MTWRTFAVLALSVLVWAAALGATVMAVRAIWGEGIFTFASLAWTAAAIAGESAGAALWRLGYEGTTRTEASE